LFLFHKAPNFNANPDYSNQYYFSFLLLCTVIALIEINVLSCSFENYKHCFCSISNELVFVLPVNWPNSNPHGRFPQIKNCLRVPNPKIYGDLFATASTINNYTSSCVALTLCRRAKHRNTWHASA